MEDVVSNEDISCALTRQTEFDKEKVIGQASPPVSPSPSTPPSPRSPASSNEAPEVTALNQADYEPFEKLAAKRACTGRYKSITPAEYYDIATNSESETEVEIANDRLELEVQRRKNLVRSARPAIQAKSPRLARSSTAEACPKCVRGSGKVKGHKGAHKSVLPTTKN